MTTSRPTRKNYGLLALAAIAVALYGGQRISSQGQNSGRRTIIVNGYEAVAGEVLVRFNRVLANADRLQMETQIAADDSEPLTPNLRRFRSRSYDVGTLLSYLRTRGDVSYAEPNYIQYAFNTIPNDSSFGSLWGLLNTGQTVNGYPGTSGKDIHATAAWDVSTGSKANVVAIVDTGVDYNHPDLAANIWSAPTAFNVTIGGSTINCAAGTHGFNAITKTCDPMDDNNHGTHVSGTIGGIGNNGSGVAGVNWTASIMGTKFLSASGSGSTGDAVNAIEFAIQAKQQFGAQANVRVLSNSWGGGGFSQSLLDEINKAGANDMLFVAAAGNNAANTDVSINYPSGYNAANIIAVAATDNDDNLASFSNYGATSVDLAAPGVNVLSTIKGNAYAYYNGTSMATPHVSGAAALVLSKCTLDTAGLKANLMNNAEAVGGLTGKMVTGGRLNVDAAIRACANVPPPLAPGAPTLSLTAGNKQVALSWSAPSGASTYTVKRGTAAGQETTTVVSGLTGTTYTNTGLTNGTKYYYIVLAVNAGGSTPSAEQSATPFGPPAAPTGLVATSGPNNGQITLNWNAAPTATSYIVRRATSSIGSLSTIASGVTALTFTDTGLTRGKRYYYVVAATNSAGTSANTSRVNTTAK